MNNLKIEIEYVPENWEQIRRALQVFMEVTKDVRLSATLFSSDLTTAWLRGDYPPKP